MWIVTVSVPPRGVMRKTGVISKICEVNSMTVEASLNYQQIFFNDFATAWSDWSTYRLYQGIDKTASTLRLEVTETPGYILAYDKNAQDELNDFLQAAFVKFLREHVPFFEVSDDGQVFFGDWYHRRQFGQLSVFTRTIDQATPQERNILPQLMAFAQLSAKLFLRSR